MTFKPLAPLYGDGIDWRTPFDDDVWELYHVAEDVSETEDLAEQEPGARLADRWSSAGGQEAGAHQVLPLDNRVLHTILQPPAPGGSAATEDADLPVRRPMGAPPVPEPVAVDADGYRSAAT